MERDVSAFLVLLKSGDDSQSGEVIFPIVVWEADDSCRNPSGKFFAQQAAKYSVCVPFDPAYLS